MTPSKNISRPTVMNIFRGNILGLFLLLSALLFAFVKLASEVGEGDTMAFDKLVMASLRNPNNLAVPIGPHWLQVAMLDLTSIGGVAVLSLLTVIVTALLAVNRNGRLALFVAVAVSSGATVSTLLKSLFHRPRPELVAHLVNVNTTSFPSGHAMNSAVVYLTLGALLAKTLSDQKARSFVMAVSVALTLIVGFSRIYLGVHWPSDVLAGWAVGASWALLCSLVLRTLEGKLKMDYPATKLD